MISSYALVLTAAPSPQILTEQTVKTLNVLFPDTQRTTGCWLAPGIAYEVLWNEISWAEAHSVKEKVLQTLHPLQIDVNLVEAIPQLRRKKLLVADMESTIIEQELIDELAAYVQKKELMSALTLQTMQGEIDFTSSLRKRVKLLAGLNSKAFEQVLFRITETPGTQKLLSQMKSRGAKTALISSGCHYFTEQISRRYGFDTHTGTIWDIKDNMLTGEVLEPLIDATSKNEHLLRLTTRYQLDIRETLAVGDGANDLLMLQTAGLGVAFHAKPLIRAAMLKCRTGAVIDYADLRALLALQGEKF